jgi:hypothetical protein
MLTLYIHRQNLFWFLTDIQDTQIVNIYTNIQCNFKLPSIIVNYSNVDVLMY